MHFESLVLNARVIFDVATKHPKVTDDILLQNFFLDNAAFATAKKRGTDLEKEFNNAVKCQCTPACANPASKDQICWSFSAFANKTVAHPTKASYPSVAVRDFNYKRVADAAEVWFAALPKPS